MSVGVLGVILSERNRMRPGDVLSQQNEITGWRQEVPVSGCVMKSLSEVLRWRNFCCCAVVLLREVWTTHWCRGYVWPCLLTKPQVTFLIVQVLPFVHLFCASVNVIPKHKRILTCFFKYIFLFWQQQKRLPLAI